MIKRWKALYKCVGSFQESLQGFFSVVTVPGPYNSKMKELVKAWADICKFMNELDEFITPVEPLQLTAIEDKKLSDTWHTWKEYLQEQHGFSMRSRMEHYSLQLLTRLSAGDPAKAVEYLEYAMSRGYRNFFKPDEKQAEKEAVKDGSDF